MALAIPQKGRCSEIKNKAVTVKDTGIGMTSSELSQAFEPFYRSERGRSNSPGHGLGLSIVRRLVHQFEWKISVQVTLERYRSHHQLC